MALVDATGTGAFLAVSVIFLTRSVGLPLAQVGLGLSLGAGVALLTTVPVGGLADRYGARRVLVLVCLWRAACFAVYPLVFDLTSFVVVVCLLGLVDKTAAPLQQALVSAAAPPGERLDTLAVMRSLRNVGFTLGAGLGSVALTMDDRVWYSAILLINAVSFLVAGLIAGRLPLHADTCTVRRTFSVRALRDVPYLAVAGINAVLALHMTLLSVAVPFWVATHSRAPRSTIGILLAVNTVLAVAFQVRASRGADVPGTAAAKLRASGLALAGCCVLLAVVPPLPPAASIALLVLAMVALTVGELLQSAGGWGLSFALARADQQTAYLSVFWLGISVQQIAAPTIIVTVISTGVLGWVGLAAVLLAVGMAVPVTTRWVMASQDRRLGPQITPPARVHPTARRALVGP